MIPNAIYWDDWTLYRVADDVILDTFRQAGTMFNLVGHLHNILLGVGLWVYKALTFVLMFLAGVALNRILEKYTSAQKEIRFLVVLLFLISPFYWARVALIDIGYTVCYFLFFLAWSLADRCRFISLLLFFLSFNTNSLLVFYALPFLDKYFQTVKEPASPKALFRFGLRNLDFLILPFLYFSIKIIFFQPFGLYEGYNEHYSLSNLALAPIQMFLDWAKLQISLFVVIVLGAFFSILINYTFKFPKNTSIKSSNIIFIGAGAFFFGAFPYWILGHIPSFTEWTSRHQLLLPLGFSLFVVGFLGYIQKEAKSIIIGFLIAICVSLNFFTYRDFFIDWQKQKQLISLFRTSTEVRDAEIIIFSDSSLELNAVRRTFRPYEWNGLLVEAFGDETRLGLTSVDFDRLLSGHLFKGYFSSGGHYRMSDFQLSSSPIVLLVNIESTPTKLVDRLRRLGLPELKLVTSSLPSPNLSVLYPPQ